MGTIWIWASKITGTSLGRTFRARKGVRRDLIHLLICLPPHLPSLYLSPMLLPLGAELTNAVKVDSVQDSQVTSGTQDSSESLSMCFMAHMQHLAIVLVTHRVDHKNSKPIPILS